MGPEFIDNTSTYEIKRLIEEIEHLNQKLDFLKEKIQSIQCHCKHIFLETPGMRKCQKCGFAESTYY